MRLTEREQEQLQAITIMDMAFPAMSAIGHSDFAPGLTKREFFAAMAMQGFCTEGVGGKYQRIAEDAVEIADALLAVLAK